MSINAFPCPHWNQGYHASGFLKRDFRFQNPQKTTSFPSGKPTLSSVALSASKNTLLCFTQCGY